VQIEGRTGAEFMQQGMERSVGAGLIEKDGDHWAIHDWADHQPIESNAERQRRFRAKKKAAGNATAPLRNVTGNEVTLDGTGQDGTGQEKIRKRRSRPSHQYPDDWPGHVLASDWMAGVPGLQTPTDRQRVQAAWHAALDRLSREHAWEDIARLVRWVAAHPFWSKNCRSPAKLLKLDKDGIRYWDRLWGEMTTDGTRRRSVELETLPDVLS
jgi:hypothetical protein